MSKNTPEELRRLALYGGTVAMAAGLSGAATRIEELERALKPFAEVAEYQGTTPPSIKDSEMYLWTYSEGRSGIVRGITKAHVMAARAALEGKEKQP